MTQRRAVCWILGVALIAGASSRAAEAQDPPAPAAPEAAAPEGPYPIPGVRWKCGPADGALGEESVVKVPAGWWFTGKSGTASVMRAMQNPVNGEEMGMVVPPETGWFCVFEFSPEGYVNDDDRDDLDADEMLEAMKEGNKRSNEQRKRMGYERLELVGWEVPPHYDTTTNLLEWALRFRDSHEKPVVNMNVRLLGRGGVMSATWVGEPADMAAAMPAFRSLLAGHEFNSGHRYAEYTKGDKVAEYGLAGLVAGGAVAAAAKSGLLGKLWKVIVAVVVAVIAGARKLFGGGSKPAGRTRTRTARTVQRSE